MSRAKQLQGTELVCHSIQPRRRRHGEYCCYKYYLQFLVQHIYALPWCKYTNLLQMPLSWLKVPLAFFSRGYKGELRNSQLRTWNAFQLLQAVVGGTVKFLITLAQALYWPDFQHYTHDRTNERRRAYYVVHTHTTLRISVKCWLLQANTVRAC